LNDTLVCGAQLIMPRSLASDAPARKRQTCYERRRTQALAKVALLHHQPLRVGRVLTLIQHPFESVRKNVRRVPPRPAHTPFGESIAARTRRHVPLSVSLVRVG
jgi:hypothetical protein